MPKRAIRRARAEDAASLKAVFRAAYAAWTARLDGLPDVAGGIAADIAEHLVWVAESPAGAMLGGVVLILGGEAAQVANLAVDPSVSGQGIGQALLARAEAAARAGGYHRLCLTTHRDMAPTLRFYRRQGWAITGDEGVRVFLEKTLG